MSQQPILILGYGSSGRALTARLLAAGRSVHVVQRHRPANLPAGVAFDSIDIFQPSALLPLASRASHMVITIGFAYDTQVWRDLWPAAMRNLLAVAATTGIRTIFFDNCYLYGPQTAPIGETTPLKPWGGKAAIRRAITEQWQQAVAQGQVRFTALRVPDFYGPGVANSHLSDRVFGNLARGKPASVAVPVDFPHDVAYVPDIARALESLINASDDIYGEVWHMPCAPTHTLREIITLGAQALALPPRIQALPLIVLPVLGLFHPVLREIYDIRFTWNRPYRIDASKFTRRFWSDVTPIEVGIAETARSFA